MSFLPDVVDGKIFNKSHIRRIKHQKLRILLAPERKKRRKLKERGHVKTRKLSHYKQYISSDVWTERRNRYWQTHPKRCAICDAYRFIHLHHMVYHTYDGTEPDKHLVALCEDHHAEYHSKNGTQGNMLAKTLAFIDESRQKLEFAALHPHL